MKNRYQALFSSLLAATLLLIAVPTASAQTIVEPSADPAGYLNNVISGDTTATGERNETHYILRSGGLYLTNGEIENEGWPLIVEAEDGATERPQIIPVVGDGGESVRPFTPRGPITLRGLYITAMDDLGGVVGRIVRVRADDIRVIVDDVHFDYAGQSAMRFDNANNKVYITNSIFSNIGRMDSPNNGRGLDMRGNAIDTVWVEGNTFYNLTSRAYRGGGGSVNWVRWSHNTMVNVGQFTTSFDEAAEVTMTNNVAINNGFLGVDRPEESVSLTGLVDVDSLASGDPQSINIANNNFWNDQALIDQLLAIDADSDGTGDRIFRPLFSVSTQAFVDEAGTGETNLSEELTFANFLGSQPVIDALLGDTDGDELTFSDLESRDNPFVDGAIPAYDFAYGTSTTSFTASTAGQPLGDLNWFGLTIIPTSNDGDVGADLPKAFILHGNYPNPFNPTTTLAFDLRTAAEVQVAVFDVLGREVMALPVQRFAAGPQQVTLDASALASGLYLSRVTAQAGPETLVRTGHMTLLK
ncbi:MAG: T9SS type A sorting domain-containing protein [Bacteroidota bacterium]